MFLLAQAALGDPLQYIGNFPFNLEPPLIGQPVTLDPNIANPIPGDTLQLLRNKSWIVKMSAWSLHNAVLALHLHILSMS